MSKKLGKAPVYYTVAQVQFNPVLDLDNYVPAIQSKLREAHFPDFKQDVIQRLVLPFAGVIGQSPAPSVTPQSRYQFGDIAGSSTFLLETNALSFQTTAYDTFETFSATLLKGLEVVHASLRLDFVERIGLRYLDAVQPPEGQSLRDFVVPEVLGMSLLGAGQLQQSMSETYLVTPSGQLTSRVLIRDGAIGFPAELNGWAPTIAPRFADLTGLHAILDTDASLTRRDSFDLDRMATTLHALHGEIVKSFHATVTPHALAAWA